VDSQNPSETERQTLRRQTALRYVVRCAGFHQLDRGLLVAEPGQHDEGRQKTALTRAAHDVEAVGSGHAVVEKRAVEMLRLELRESAVGILRFRDVRLESGRLERAPHRHAVDVVVIDYQDLQGAFGHLAQGISTSVQYLLSVAIRSQKLLNVTGLRR
jgi:hypothetical protein